MRLIDADELKDIIDGSDDLIDWQKEELKLWVDACDTTYDVDKVVEQIETDERHTFDGCINKRYAIEIVKAGGVDE